MEPFYSDQVPLTSKISFSSDSWYAYYEYQDDHQQGISLIPLCAWASISNETKHIQEIRGVLIPGQRPQEGFAFKAYVREHDIAHLEEGRANSETGFVSWGEVYARLRIQQLTAHKEQLMKQLEMQNQ